jgi:hypothetical protein
MATAMPRWHPVVPGQSLADNGQSRSSSRPHSPQAHNQPVLKWATQQVGVYSRCACMRQLGLAPPVVHHKPGQDQCHATYVQLRSACISSSCAAQPTAACRQHTAAAASCRHAAEQARKQAPPCSPPDPPVVSIAGASAAQAYPSAETMVQLWSKGHTKWSSCPAGSLILGLH